MPVRAARDESNQGTSILQLYAKGSGGVNLRSATSWAPYEPTMSAFGR